MVGSYILAERLSPNKWVGPLAAFLVGTYPIVFGHARLVGGDVPNTFWVTVTLALLVFRPNMRPLLWGSLLGVCIGLGLLTQWRFPIYVAVPLLVIFLQIMTDEPKGLYPRRDWIVGILSAIAIALVLAAPWYVQVLPQLIPQLKEAMDAARTEGDPLVFSWDGLLWYLFSFINHQVGIMAAAFFWIVGGVWIWVSRRSLTGFLRPGWYKGLRLLTLGLISMFLIITLLYNKDPRYMMPALVPIAIITATGLTRACQLPGAIGSFASLSIPVIVATGLLILLTVSFVGIPKQPIVIRIGTQWVTLAASTYHVVHPVYTPACNAELFFASLGRATGKEVIGIKSDDSEWNVLNFPFWNGVPQGSYQEVDLRFNKRLEGYRGLVLGGSWANIRPPDSYWLIDSCTGWEGSKVNFFRAPFPEEISLVDLLSIPQAEQLGQWEATHVVLQLSPGMVVSTSVASASIWAETYFRFYAPFDFSRGSGVRLRWHVVPKQVKALIVFLDDTKGNRLVWDRTPQLRDTEGPFLDDLNWAEADILSGFDFTSVERIAISLLELDPPVHPRVILDIAQIPQAPK